MFSLCNTTRAHSTKSDGCRFSDNLEESAYSIKDSITILNDYTMSGENKVYVVAVDSRADESNSTRCYKEEVCGADYFQQNIVNHPKMKCCQSTLAEMCGMNLKVYFMKYKVGLAQHYRSGGEAAVMNVMVSNPDFLASNNGAASWLTTDPDNGFPEYTICGKAYVVRDDGRAPLSKGQVWAIQEMVNCVMDRYDMDPANMVKGKRTLERWSSEYKMKTWMPPSGLLGGINIYDDRQV